MKKLVNSIFPYFDTQALDAALFFFGTTAAEVALYPGRMNLTEFLDEDLFDEDMEDGQHITAFRKLLFAVTVVKYSEESVETIVATNPSSGAASAN